ncbi:MAG: hypothetical protein DRG78_04865 [Epsilonproteobacteria bacterium]|nr:MAG: hypothetical protein DRG78_04865 [Campylobacterota bacterium]
MEHFLSASFSFYTYIFVILLQKNIILFGVSIAVIRYIKNYGYSWWNFTLITMVGAYTIYELNKLGSINSISDYTWVLYASYFICYSVLILYAFFLLRNLNIVFLYIMEQIASTARGIRDIILIVIWRTPKVIIIFIFTYTIKKPFGLIFKRKSKQNISIPIKKTSSISFWKIITITISFIWKWFIVFPFKLLFIDDNKRVKTFTPKGKGFNAGGEGEVYSSGFNKIIKIFHKDQATQLKLDVINKLIDMDLPKFIIKPTSVVQDKAGNFIGYEMPKAKGVPLEELYFEGGLAKYFPKYNLLDIFDLSITIVNAYEQLHKYSIIAGDINDGNLFVVNSFDVNIIDTDSFQINRPNGVGKILYTRPINHNKSEDSYMKNYSDDTFAIIVLIFRLMLGGYAPYHEDDNYEIKDTYFPFQPNNPSYSNNVVPKDIIKSYHTLPNQMQQLFFNIFELKQSIQLPYLLEILTSSREEILA